MEDRDSTSPISEKYSNDWKSMPPEWFLSIMLHELRTPILTIKGFATILSDETQKEMHPGAIEAILSNAKRLDQLWNDMANYNGELMRRSDP